LRWRFSSLIPTPDSGSAGAWPLWIERSGTDREYPAGQGTHRPTGRSRSGEATPCDAAQALALNGGEDYELLFTTARPEAEWLEAVSRAAKTVTAVKSGYSGTLALPVVK